MTSRLPRVRILILTLLSLFIPMQSRSQGFPWYTIPLPIPNGFVDAATDNVHLEIPLGPPVQPMRDGELSGSKLAFDSTYHGYQYQISMFNTQSGWYGLSANSHSGDASLTGNGTQPCPSGYPNGSVSLQFSPSFTDYHGTHHTAINNNVYTKRVDCYTTSNVPYGNGSDITSFNEVATDGSGYSFQVTNYNQLQVYSPDGWLVYDNATGSPYPRDTNGNFGSQPNTSVSSTGGLCPSYPQRIPPTYTSTTTYKTSDGTPVSYTITCTAESVAEIQYGTQYTGTVSFLTNISLEDGTQYVFGYDTGTSGNHHGGLQSMTLPDGGVVSFTFAPGWPTVVGGGLPASVTVGGGTWNLNYSYNATTGITTSTVVSPAGDKSIFTSVPFNNYLKTAQYYSGSSTLKKTVTTTYDSNGNFLPVTITTTLNDTGQSSSVSYQYYQTLMRNFPTQKTETDFNGTVVRTTVTAYAGYYTKPTSIKVYAGSNISGTPVSSTLFTYDEYSASYCKNSVPGLTNFTGAYGHDDVNYGKAFLSRG